MDLVTSIKESVSEISIANLSGYLEEDINGTKLGLDLGIGTFLAGVIKFSATDKSGRGLLAILNDGGHTGDILKNFESFSGKPEKSKLLETIGSNIVNHFLKDKAEGLIARVSGHAGIKESSSAKLLNLVAPLVLGFLGKKVREDNLSGQDLKAYLSNATAAVSGTLPSSLVHALNLPMYRPGKSMSHSHAVTALNKDENRKNWSMVLPWVFLLLLGGLIWYFSHSKDKTEPSATQEVALPDIFLPQDTALRTPKPSADPPAASAEPPARQEVSTEAKSEETKREETKREETKPEEEEYIDSPPAGATSVPVYAFSKGSAEIVDQSALAPLLSALKQSHRKVVLIPLSLSGTTGVDRAYALRDFLIDNGVDFSRIEIAAPGRGRNDSGVAWK